MSIALFAKRRFNPLSIFAAGNPGIFVPDSSDMSALFQNSVGTTSVTAVEQPVGLVLDNSQGLAIGPDLVAGGDFSGGSTTGWIPNAATLSVVAGEAELTCTTAGTFQTNYQISTIAGTTYKITASVRRGTCPQPVYVGFNGIGARATNSTVNVSIQVYLKATASSTNVQVYSTGASIGHTLYFDNISVVAVPGNHATQATAAKCLTYKFSTSYDLYCDGVDDSLTAMAGGGSTTAFFFCAAIRANNTEATQTIWSDTGTNAGYRVRINSSNQLELAVGNGSAYTTVNTTATLAIGQRAIITCWHDGANIYAQIDQGAVASAVFATATAGTAGFTIGQDNGASSNYFKGGIIGLIQVKNVSPADGVRSQTQRYLAQLGLITL